MIDMTDILILSAIVALALCVAVWRLAKAGGGVDVGFHVSVNWGRK
jgi:hypothetical protein